MASIEGYSSEDDNGEQPISNDTFGLSSIPTSKRPRFENETVDAGLGKIETGAPDVLTEVRLCML